jgi:hypothetical protein
MKDIRAIAIVALAITCAAVAASAVAGSRSHAWLFTTTMGRPLAEEQVYWWLVLLPLGVGAMAVLSLCGVSAVRACSVRDWRLVVALVSIGALSVAAMAAGLDLRYQWLTLQQGAPQLARPSSHHEVFRRQHWQALAQQLLHEGRPTPDLLPGTGGIEGHPGMIPFDAYLLKRLTFVGLRPEQVEVLLGPPLPRKVASILGSPMPHTPPEQLVYFMPIGPVRTTALLFLGVATDEQGVSSIANENLRLKVPRWQY